jgi:hypothetical protein
VAVIQVFAVFPGAVEKYYSTGIYPAIARLQRLLFGWIPFSIGDLFYGAVALWLFYGIISFTRKNIKKQVDREYFLSVIRRLIFFPTLVYVLFNLLWGLNYDRKGIAYQLQLDVKPYSTAELSVLLHLIVNKLNALDNPARQHREELKNKSSLFTAAGRSYGILAVKEPVFAYTTPSIKPSLFSLLGNYLGFSGYYNPFSGEAQVNTTMPAFTRPFTTCHEMGHQLGYAKENEANFAGYLAASSSNDPAFQYSVYLDLYVYAARELYSRDSNLVKPFREQLAPPVRKDLRDLQQFYRKYENPLEPIIGRLYGRFLKANGQPQGMMTYNEVLAWLIAYYKKTGCQGI